MGKACWWVIWSPRRKSWDHFCFDIRKEFLIVRAFQTNLSASHQLLSSALLQSSPDLLPTSLRPLPYISHTAAKVILLKHRYDHVIS